MTWLFKVVLKCFLYVVSSFALLAAGFFVYLIWFQSPFYFPKPTGPYAVGVKTYHWIDTKRKELYTTDPAHPFHELLVKCWYPTDPATKPSPTRGQGPEMWRFPAESATVQEWWL